MKIIRLGKDRYFENQFWHMANELYDQDAWAAEDFVGLISYKYERKTQSDISTIIQTCKDNIDADVVALYDFDINLMTHACEVHGEIFKEAWTKLFAQNKFTDKSDRDDLPAFYCNFWLAKPEQVLAYSAWAVQVMDQMNTMEIMQSNSLYRGLMSKDQLISLTGHNYYALHPFIMERLPCIYFYLNNCKIARLRHPNKIWKIWQPLAEDRLNSLLLKDAKTLAVFATHSSKDVLEKNTLFYINELAVNYDIVIVVSTQSDIKNIQELPVNCRSVQCENSCHDFGLHFRILYNLNTSRFEEIGLFNDSCWVLKSMTDLFARCRSLSSNVVGLTDSIEVSRHLQSFFLVFRGTSMRHLIDFVQSSQMYPNRMSNKWYVIVNFEIGLSKYMIKHSESLKAVYDMSSVYTAPSHFNSKGTNTSYQCWDRLLALGCPLLKKARLTYKDEFNYIIQNMI